MTQQQAFTERFSLDIAGLTPGDIAVSGDPSHPSWSRLRGWDDPFMPRGGYVRKTLKERVDHERGPAIRFLDHPSDQPAHSVDRALVTGEAFWRDYSVSCRFESLEDLVWPNEDADLGRLARAGIAFRIETSRRHYYLCLEAMRRVVLYRRMDHEWYPLASHEVAYRGQTLTMEVDLRGDAIFARCPELGCDIFCTDTLIPCGKAGFRARGRTLLFALEVAMNSAQRAINQRAGEAIRNRTARLAQHVPAAREAGVIELCEGQEYLAHGRDFHTAGRYDLLLSNPDSLTATTWEGSILWSVPGRPVAVNVSADPLADGARLVFCLMGSRVRNFTDVGGLKRSRAVPEGLVVLHGRTGAVMARAPLPDDSADPNGQFEQFSVETGNLVSGKAYDIVLKKGFHLGSRRIWAYDASLNPLWSSPVMPPYGHGNAVHLVDLLKTGRSQVLAGGTLFSADGEPIWVHDMAHELVETRVKKMAGLPTSPNHYDAALGGFFDGDEPDRPVVFLMAGGDGVYVLDGKTGKTTACHRVGHAQWGMRCRVRSDIPGEQILVGTRWDNMGILTLFSGRGERLWSIQPDYILQGTCPVQWVPGAAQHIWHNTSRDAFGLYDGYGRLTQPLDSMRRLWDEQTRMTVRCFAMQRSPSAAPLLAMHIGQRIHLFEREG